MMTVISKTLEREQRGRGVLQSIVLGQFKDVMLQRLTPRDIIHLLNIISVCAERAQKLAHPQSRMACDMCHAERLLRSKHGRRHHHSRDVIYRHHVDGVVNIRHLTQLRTSLDHSDQEIVRIAHTSLGVTCNVAGANDGSSEATLASSTYDVLGRPLGLTVTCTQAGSGSFQIIALRNSRATRVEDGVGELNVVVRIDNRGGRDESERFGFAGSTEEEGVYRAFHIGAVETIVVLKPMDLYRLLVK